MQIEEGGQEAHGEGPLFPTVLLSSSQDPCPGLSVQLRLEPRTVAGDAKNRETPWLFFLKQALLVSYSVRDVCRSDSECSFLVYIEA